MQKLVLLKTHAWKKAIAGARGAQGLAGNVVPIQRPPTKKTVPRPLKKPCAATSLAKDELVQIPKAEERACDPRPPLPLTWQQREMLATAIRKETMAALRREAVTVEVRGTRVRLLNANRFVSLYLGERKLFALMSRHMLHRFRAQEPCVFDRKGWDELDLQGALALHSLTFFQELAELIRNGHPLHVHAPRDYRYVRIEGLRGPLYATVQSRKNTLVVHAVQTRTEWKHAINRRLDHNKPRYMRHPRTPRRAA